MAEAVAGVIVYPLHSLIFHEIFEKLSDRSSTYNRDERDAMASCNSRVGPQDCHPAGAP
jgi:hypothetical protein